MKTRPNYNNTIMHIRLPQPPSHKSSEHKWTPAPAAPRATAPPKPALSDPPNQDQSHHPAAKIRVEPTIRIGSDMASTKDWTPCELPLIPKNIWFHSNTGQRSGNRTRMLLR
ncbi:Uncharacterized protein Fot_11519 [Forsythia ovata]|uniref:Uncharacterized protein n=1 Tax=Forsythia ovata TaxID=205694 RepID=A0ABD1WJW3_9LAMI